MVKWRRVLNELFRFELFLAGERTEILMIGHSDVRFKASSRFIGGYNGVSLHRRTKNSLETSLRFAEDELQRNRE